MKTISERYFGAEYLHLNVSLKRFRSFGFSYRNINDNSYLFIVKILPQAETVFRKRWSLRSHYKKCFLSTVSFHISKLVKYRFEINEMQDLMQMDEPFFEF